jgi:hypothetical protein
MDTSAATTSSRRNGTVPVNGAWLQRELDLRLMTATQFAQEVRCDDSTLRKALDSQLISVRKVYDILQALRRLPVEPCDVLDGLLGVPSS